MRLPPNRKETQPERDVQPPAASEAPPPPGISRASAPTPSRHPRKNALFLAYSPDNRRRQQYLDNPCRIWKAQQSRGSRSRPMPRSAINASLSWLTKPCKPAPPRSVAGAAVLYRQQPPICKGCRSGFRPVSEITTEADGLSETGPGTVVLPIRCPARLPRRVRPERPADPSAPEALPRCPGSGDSCCLPPATTPG